MECSNALRFRRSRVMNRDARINRQRTNTMMKNTRYLRARLQLAHLPFLKTFEQFDFGFQPSIDEKQIRELRTLRFVHEASNVILLGPPDPATLCFTSFNSIEQILLFFRFSAGAA